MKNCPNCNTPVEHKLAINLTRRYDCRHQGAVWLWSCACGWLESKNVERCPYCVGIRPPESAR